MAEETIQDLIYRERAKIATIDDHHEWVNSVAKEIDRNTQMHLAADFDRIIRHLKKTYSLAGASSNNLFWEMTDAPIRVIFIPIAAGRYITLVNPAIQSLAGSDFKSIEACGSIPDDHYMVTRKSYAVISGYTLENEFATFTFGSKDADLGPHPALTAYNRYEWVVQHEMDHFDGITIKDKGTLFDLNSLMELV